MSLHIDRLCLFVLTDPETEIVFIALYFHSALKSKNVIETSKNARPLRNSIVIIETGVRFGAHINTVKEGDITEDEFGYMAIHLERLNNIAEKEGSGFNRCN